MDKIIWDKWVSNWNWILEIAKKRNWDTDPLIIKPTINADEIIQIENEFQIKYPFEFKTILTQYSSGVLFSWQIENEETEGAFREIFCGCGRGYLWDIETLKSDVEKYNNWVSRCFSNIDDEYDKIWHNKVPFSGLFVSTLLAISYSTLRGMMFALWKDTYLKSVILPIINVPDLLKSKN